VRRRRPCISSPASGWAIRRFVDADATFEFVPRTRDVSGADGIPFDLRGAELGHHQGRCTLEALIDKYEIADEALGRMARIIRAADLPQDDPVPAVAPGVLAIFDGIRDGCETDEERLAKGFVVCDALYAYCRQTKEAASEL
jgi:hypothetical protein